MSDDPGLWSEDTARTAELSADGVYRYRLTRVWSAPAGLLTFIMLNPSTADATVDDPTIRRCVSFGKRERYAGIEVLNLYAFRVTKPRDLFVAREMTGGRRNDTLLREALERAAVNGRDVVAAWGTLAYPDRVEWLKNQPHADRLVCLGATQNGSPRHPLYVKGSQPFIRWPVSGL